MLAPPFQRRAVLLALLLVPLTVIAQAQRRIQLAQLEAMFANMRAKTKWNVDGPLLWGYFFLDPSEQKLQQAANELSAAGYRVVGVKKVEGRDLYRLHVERIEAHTPLTLNERNNEFYAFAEKRAIALYDGMDVGPAPSSPR
jgi:hypothetical protein